MRECTERDNIDTGGRELLDGLDRDSPARFREHVIRECFDSAFDFFGREVVEEHDISARLGGTPAIVRSFDFDFDFRRERDALAEVSDRGLEAEFGDVVLLDEYHMGEVEAMCVPATSSDRALFESPETRSGFPGAGDPDIVPDLVGSVDDLAGFRRDA